jgi:hypothetical protein
MPNDFDNACGRRPRSRRARGANLWRRPIDGKKYSSKSSIQDPASVRDFRDFGVINR